MATLTFEHVTKQFGRNVLAVNDFSLHVEDGEFLVLLGPSGCGKTTCMRMVAGLEEVTEGRIYIEDDDVTELPPRKRNVSMIFQNYAVWPHMSVYDNISYALKLKKMDKDEIDKIVHEVVRMVKIEPFLDRLPAQLSGGQQQRVLIARALVGDPCLLILDEPTAGLDPAARARFYGQVCDLQRASGLTLFCASHDVDDVAQHAQTLILLDHSVRAMGPPQEVLTSRAVPEVYHFPPPHVHTDHHDGGETHQVGSEGQGELP